MPTESTAAKTDCKLTIVLGSAWPGTQAAQTRRHEEGWKTERPSGYKSRETSLRVVNNILSENDEGYRMHILNQNEPIDNSSHIYVWLLIKFKNTFIRKRPFFANKNVPFAKLSQTPRLSLAGPMLGNNASYEDLPNYANYARESRITS